MSVHYEADRRRFVVRWRVGGRQRSKRFRTEPEAVDFDESMGGPQPASEQAPTTRAAGDGVYAYATRQGVRYRFLFRQSDGSVSSRRGFTSRAAAVTARRRLLESIERGEIKVCREDFETFWSRFASERRAYLTAGSHLDLMTHGRKRLLPFFAGDQLSSIDSDRVRDWLAGMVELVETGELSPKTVNNARTYLSVALNEAARRGLIPRNPCDGVPALPLERTEIEFLRLAKIDPYLSACSEAYRPLAAFLIGTGARISEAVATRWADLDLDEGVVRIYRQRARESSASRVTKGSDSDRSRSGRALARRCERSESTAFREHPRRWLDLPLPSAAPGTLRRPNPTCAAPPQDRSRLARCRPARRGDARHAPALAATRRGCSLARCSPPAHLRSAPTRPSLNHDHRGALGRSTRTRTPTASAACCLSFATTLASSPGPTG